MTTGDQRRYADPDAGGRLFGLHGRFTAYATELNSWVAQKLKSWGDTGQTRKVHSAHASFDSDGQTLSGTEIWHDLYMGTDDGGAERVLARLVVAASADVASGGAPAWVEWRVSDPTDVVALQKLLRLVGADATVRVPGAISVGRAVTTDPDATVDLDVAGDAKVNGVLKVIDYVSAYEYPRTAIGTVTLGATENALDLDGTDIWVLTVPSGGTTLNGIAAPDHGLPKKLTLIVPSTANQLTVANLSASAATGDKIVTNTNANRALTVSGGGCLELCWTPTTNNWRITSWED